MNVFTGAIIGFICGVAATIVFSCLLASGKDGKG